MFDVGLISSDSFDSSVGTDPGSAAGAKPGAIDSGRMNETGKLPSRLTVLGFLSPSVVLVEEGVSACASACVSACVSTCVAALVGGFFFLELKHEDSFFSFVAWWAGVRCACVRVHLRAHARE